MTGAANAISVSGEAGQHYTNLGVGAEHRLFRSGPDRQLGAQRHHDGNVGSVEVELRRAAGAVDGDRGQSAVPQPERWEERRGGGAGRRPGVGNNRYFSLHGEGYFAPDSFTSGVKAYNEASGGCAGSSVR